MFAILLSIVLTTCILAAPAPTHNQTSIQWSKYKEDLKRFQSTLLNDTKLPFLTECQTNAQSTTIKITCSLYIDAIIQLNSTDYIINEPTMLKVRDQANATAKFCEQKHTFPSRKYTEDVHSSDLNNMVKCGHLCLEDDAETAKPICIFLAWMGDEINNKKATAKIVATTAATAVAAPKKIPLGDVSSKVSQVINNVPQKIIDTVQQAKTPETIKDDSIPDKPVPKLPIVPIKLSQSNNTSENPIKTEIEDKQPKIKGDEISSTNQKEEKQFIDDGQDETGPAPLDSNQEDPTKQVTSSKIPKTDNIDSEIEGEEDNQDDSGEDERYGQINDNKPNKVGIVDPEHDQNHSSSQEIINNKIIPTTTTTEKLKDPFHEQSGSNFFTYFLIGMFLCIAMYVFYHNKSKILALVLEGRRGDKGRSGRRKHTAAYRKLDSNLEEAITSSARGRTTQIIY